MASGTDDTTLPPDQLFLKNLDLIERQVRYFASRAYLKPDEIEEFASIIRLKLIAHDYEVIRKYQRKCSFKTYLSVVIKRALLDHLDHLWGKWRPSAEAKSLGPLAVKLEQLLHKERFTLGEACQILQINFKVEKSTQELMDLAALLPRREPYQEVGEESLFDLVDSGSLSDGGILEKEIQEKRRRIFKALREVLKGLPQDEQVIIDLKKEGVKVKAMALMVGIEQKKLYRRVDGILGKLRHQLEQQGIHLEDIREIMDGVWL